MPENPDNRNPDEEPETQTERRQGTMIGSGIAIGAGLGVALGLVFDNLALGIAIGVAIGTALGAAFEQRTGTGENEVSRKRWLYIVLIIGLVLFLVGLVLVGLFISRTR